jgi:hypothetical protein
MEKRKDVNERVPKMEQTDMTSYIIRQDKKYYAKGGHAFYYYEGLPADIGQGLMTGPPNISPEDTENESPTTREMIEIAKRYNGHLIGYVSTKPPENARIAVTGFEIRVDEKTARALKKDLAKRDVGPDEFMKVRRRRGIVWRFWWD